MPASESNVSGPFPCPFCGEMLPHAATECTRCDWVRGVDRQQPLTSGTQRDVLAAALSLVPGLGHIIKGHVKMGIGYMIGTLVAIFMLGPVGMVAMGFQLLLLPFYWLWVMLHAYMVPDLKPLDHHVPTRIG